MPPIDFLKAVFRECADDEAFIWRESAYHYRELLDQIETFHLQFDEIGLGSVVVLHSDLSPHGVAALLCLIERRAVVVPVAPSSAAEAETFSRIAEADFEVRMDDGGEAEVVKSGRTPGHPLYQELATAGHPGLVLFSSGSTGQPKGVVHDFDRLLEKYRTRRHCHRTLAFLLFDHIGGIDTLLYSLSNGSCLVVCRDRSPDGICAAIENHRVGVLPVAPSFLKLLSISGAHERHDLSSLEIVTYGAEMMPQSTLDRCLEMFPDVKLMQKFGASEVGTLRSKSKSSDSLWVKLGGEGFETRVVDSQLQIRAESSMLGYLNAESPFSEDGWFMTGDCVDVEGEYIRFRGRDSDIINVGGRKVYPAEVESVISALDNIAEVSVFGEDNAMMGQIVRARVRLIEAEDARALARRIRQTCKGELDSYKIPVKIDVSEESLTTERFKLRRRKRESSD